jgi:hypothetical protein
VDKFERLMAMRERVEAQRGKKSFNAAMASAKGEIGPIIKNRTVDFTSSKGRTNYRHEDFAAVAATVDPVLTKHGLSYRFSSTQADGRLRVTCLLSHEDGYSEETTLEVKDDHSGNKNDIQAIGSSATYLQRYTLKLALGLSTSTDDDGRATSNNTAPASQDDPVLDADQLAALRKALEFRSKDESKLVKILGVAALEDVFANKFQTVLNLINKEQP